jgi:hypothetical protein
MREKRRFRLIWRLAALALFVSIWIAWTQSRQAPASLALQKIKDDLYVIALSRGVGGGNIAVYLTDEGVIPVDDMFDRTTPPSWSR